MPRLAGHLVGAVDDDGLDLRSPEVDAPAHAHFGSFARDRRRRAYPQRRARDTSNGRLGRDRGAQLARGNERELACRRPSVAAPGQPRPIAARCSSATIRRWRSPAVATALPSSSTMRSSARRPARSAGLPGTTSTTSTPVRVAPLRARLWRQRPRPAGDADVGAAHAALAHQRADDAARRGVDRDGEAEADAGDRGVDADHAAEAVDERAARVARVQRGVGLDDVVDDARRPARRARAASGRARRPRRRSPSPAKPCGLPIATTSWPTRSVLGVAERGGLQVVAVGAQHGEVGERVGADDLEAQLAAVGEGGAVPRRLRPATTCAEVSRKPSGVSTTPLPAPAGMCPARVRRVTRRLATEGERRSATPTTVRE